MAEGGFGFFLFIEKAHLFYKMARIRVTKTTYFLIFHGKIE